MGSPNKLAIGFSIAAVTAVISIIALLISYASGKINNYDDEDGGGSGDREAKRAGVKLLFDLFFLMLTTGALFVPAWKIWGFSGSVSRVTIGALAGSVFMLTNMMFVSFFYFKSFEANDEEEEEEEENDDGGNEEEDEEERMDRQYFVVSNVCLALALVFSVLTGFIVREAIAVPETAVPDKVEAMKSSAHVDILYDAWKIISVCTVFILLLVFFAAFVPLFMEDMEREREEGLVFNLIIIILWTAILSVLLLVAGNLVLGKKKIGGSLGVGAFSGSLVYFSALLFMVSVLYGNLQFEERGREDGPFGSSAASISCFILALLHLSYALGTIKYRDSLVMAPPGEEGGDIIDKDGTGFVRMGGDDSEVEMS